MGRFANQGMTFPPNEASLPHLTVPRGGLPETLIPEVSQGPPLPLATGRCHPSVCPMTVALKGKMRIIPGYVTRCQSDSGPVPPAGENKRGGIRGVWVMNRTERINWVGFRRASNASRLESICLGAMGPRSVFMVSRGFECFRSLFFISKK